MVMRLHVSVAALMYLNLVVLNLMSRPAENSRISSLYSTQQKL